MKMKSKLKSHGGIKDVNRIKINYKIVKITNHSLFSKQNYNLLKKHLTH